jgi:hypothetical protein
MRSRATVQSPAGYANVNLQGAQLAARIAGQASAATRASLVSALQDASYLYQRSPAESAAGFVDADIRFGYPINDPARFVGLVGDGATNVKAILQHLFSLDLPVVLPKPATSYYLGALATNEKVFDFTGMSPLIMGQAALFTCEKPASGIATVFSLGGGCRNFSITGVTVETTDYVLATHGSGNGVRPCEIPENETETVSDGTIALYARHCLAGFQIGRGNGVRHHTFDIDIRTFGCYYGAGLSGTGENVHGRIEAEGHVRSLICYGARDVYLDVISASRVASSTADILIKTFANNEHTRNIHVRATCTGSVSNSPVVRLEHTHTSGGTASIKHVHLWLDDSGNSSSVTTSVIFSAQMDGVDQTATDSVFDNIFISGHLNGQIAHDVQPNVKGLIHLNTSREFFGLVGQWSNATEGYVFKTGDGHYWQCVRGALASKFTDIPINKFLGGSEFCLTLDIYGIADLGTTSSSVVRREQITVFGYGVTGPTIRSQTSNFNANTSANITFTVTANGNNIRIAFGGAALTAEGRAAGPQRVN